MENGAHKIDDKERTEDVKIKDTVPFSKMLLANHVRKGLDLAGYIYPTVIQATAIPMGKAGIDLLVQSKSGTGKTLIFCTVLLEAYDASIKEPQSLVIVPTREIAVQIESILNQIGKYTQNFRAVSIIGGLVLAEDRKKLLGAKAIVGTPGRLKHLMQNDVINTSELKLLILDEADKLMTSTFESDVAHIRQLLPDKKQTIACSATFCNDLDNILAKFMKNPLLISTEKRATLLVGIKQFVYELPEQKTSCLEMSAKLAELQKIFTKISFRQCLVFASSQSRAGSYKNFLEKEGWPCELISGAQDQKTRLEIFKKLREFKLRILVTTDLMARGVDSEHVNLVINLELPDDGATYLHRIGRAGRFGSHGIAITFLASKKDQDKFTKLMGKIGTGMDVLRFPRGEVNYDFWSFSNSDEEKTIFGVYGKEEDSAGKTFNIEKELANMDLDHLLPPSNGALKRLPSSNTIDDASSLAVDSEVFRGEHRPTFPSLFNFLVDHKVDRPPVKVDLFEDYKKALDSEESVAESRKPMKSVNLRNLLIDGKDENKPATRKKDIFSEYEDFKDTSTTTDDGINRNTYAIEPPIGSSSDLPPPSPLFPSPVDIIPPVPLPVVLAPVHSPSASEEESLGILSGDTSTYTSDEPLFQSPHSSGFVENPTSEESSGIVTTTDYTTTDSSDDSYSEPVMPGYSENEEADDEDDIEDDDEDSTDELNYDEEDDQLDLEEVDDSQNREGGQILAYQEESYMQWSNMYWNQMAAITDYVKFCNHAKQFQPPRM